MTFTSVLPLILLVFALVFFVIAAFVQPPQEPWRARTVCLGLACWVLSELLRGTGH